jgi:hypothetical protein
MNAGGSLRLQRCRDIGAFWPLAEAYLCQREAEHNLPLGIGLALNAGDYDSAAAYMALVWRGAAPDAIAAVALCTPPYPVLLSCDTPPKALELLVADLIDYDSGLGGVTAVKAVSKAFADMWTRRTGQPHRLHMAMRIYRLEQVIPPRPTTGRMRMAQLGDRERLVDWTMAFAAESLDAIPRYEAEEHVNDRLSGSRTRGLRIWEDGGQPVSMAGYAGPTLNGMRINFVYTPPEHRGRGYASAVTAALSQEMLDSGRKFCFLFTDLGNPTSNHIYQEIGYRPVSDVDQYRFGAEV